MGYHSHERMQIDPENVSSRSERFVILGIFRIASVESSLLTLIIGNVFPFVRSSEVGDLKNPYRVLTHQSPQEGYSRENPRNIKYFLGSK